MKFHTLKTLMIPAFIEVLKGDLSLIVAEGEPTEQQLKECWERLHNEYLELTADDNLKHYIRETGRIDDLQGKIERVNMYLLCLLELYEAEFISPKILEALGKEGYHVHFDKEHPDKYFEDLNLIPSLLKKKENELNQLRKKYDGMMDSKREMSIDQIVGANLTTISDAMKMQINESQLSVFMYCNYLNRIKSKK